MITDGNSWLNCETKKLIINGSIIIVFEPNFQRFLKENFFLIKYIESLLKNYSHKTVFSFYFDKIINFILVLLFLSVQILQSTHLLHPGWLIINFNWRPQLKCRPVTVCSYPYVCMCVCVCVGSATKSEGKVE